MSRESELPMFKLRRLLAALILIAVATLVVLVWRHLQQLSPREVLKALPEQVDLALDQLHYTQNEDGRRSWTLDADKAEYRRDDGVAELDAVTLVVYQAGRFGELRLTAEKGRLHQQSQLVEIWRNVEVVSARGEHLYTERLEYDGLQRLVRTAEPVRLVSPSMELTGTGMRAELDSGRLQLSKNVRLWLAPQERKTSGNE